ncbi:hypothetical protein H9P43_009956 [Blastocladiella emersonii ATCC 22665]|nr:hypothetical protein H9P43_009956 [Blastocladiella emersonii ATCC 22665]
MSSTTDAAAVRQRKMDTPAAETAVLSADRANTHLWYLGYGSNMNPKVLTGRRKVHPVESAPVRVPGYKLTFDCRGFPYLEPSFASIDVRDASKDTVPELHGVAFLITKDEYQQIRDTEGLAYADVEVKCTGVGSEFAGRTIFARGLIQMKEYRHGDRVPSTRYMGLLVEGSEHYKLPESYQDWLKSLPHYQPTSILQKVGRVITLLIGVPFFLITLLIRRLFKLFGAATPQGMLVVFEAYGSFIWLLYAYLLRPILGDGGDARA